MRTKSVVSLSTGLEDAEKVTVAMLVAVGSAETGRPTLVFTTKEAVRLATGDIARGTACAGCPSLEDLMHRYADAGGRFMVCPVCFEARLLREDDLVANAELGGTIPMWGWIGDEPANTFSY